MVAADAAARGAGPVLPRFSQEHSVAMTEPQTKPEALSTPDAYREHRIRHWDFVARNIERWRSGNRYYHTRLTQVLRISSTRPACH